MALLDRDDRNAVAHLTMNAPERLNALSDEMLAALQDQIDALQAASVPWCCRAPARPSARAMTSSR